MKDPRHLVVFDLETNGLDTDACEVVELACLAIDPVKVAVVPGSEFASKVRPVDLDRVDDTADKRKALEINGHTKEGLRAAPPRAAVLAAWKDHVKRYQKSGLAKPYAAGKNIRSFDLPILDRVFREDGLATKGGKQPLFDQRIQWELEDDLTRWLRLPGTLDSISMDTVREYTGLSKSGAHTALVDVRQTALLICKFIKLYKTHHSWVAFAGSAAKPGVFEEFGIGVG